MEKCEDIPVSICQDLPYNETQFPNILHHKTQKEAVTEYSNFVLLENTNCSPMLQSFLCAMHFPRCSGPGNVTKPCLALCQSVKESCEREIQRLGISMDFFPCDDLPQNDDCFDTDHPGKINNFLYIFGLCSLQVSIFTLKVYFPYVPNSCKILATIYGQPQFNNATYPLSPFIISTIHELKLKILHLCVCLALQIQRPLNILQRFTVPGYR